MTNLIKRLQATLRTDAVNGDKFERSVVGKQIKEAIDEIETLQNALEEAEKHYLKDVKVDGTIWSYRTDKGMNETPALTKWLRENR